MQVLLKGKNCEVLTVSSEEKFAEYAVKHAVLHSMDMVVVPNEADAEKFLPELESVGASFIEVLPLANILSAGTTSLVDHGTMAFLLPVVQFIEEWNISNGTDYQPRIAWELLLLLEETYVNCGDISVLSSLYCPEGTSGHWSLKSELLKCFVAWWKSTFPTGRYSVSSQQKVDAYVKFLQESGKKVMSAGIAFNRLFLRFLNALHRIPDSKIVIPFLDTELAEQEWDSLAAGHYQHFMSRLLRELGVERRAVKSIGGVRGSDGILGSIFNFELPSPHIYDSSKHCCGALSNVRLVTCNSENEEARKIIEILHMHLSDEDNCMQHELCNDALHHSTALLGGFGAASENRQVNVAKFTECIMQINKKHVVFMSNDSLSARVCSSLFFEGDYSAFDCGHLVYSLVVGVLEVILSSGDAAQLLSLLKHPLVMLEYEGVKYSLLVSEFETSVVRRSSVTGFDAIGSVMSEQQDQLIDFWRSVQDVLHPMRVLTGMHSMQEILSVHWGCIRRLTAGKRLDGSFPYRLVLKEVESFFSEANKHCTRARAFSMQSYKRVCEEVLKHCFSARGNELSSVSFARNSIVVISGFNEGEYSLVPCGTLMNNDMRMQIGLPTFEEYDGYLQCILYGLLQANRVYITRSAERCGKATEAPVLFRYMHFLLTGLPDGVEAPSVPQAANSVVATHNEVAVHGPNPCLEIRRKALSELTADAVATFVNNPYTFYARYVLGLRPVNEVNTGKMARNFASLVHVILSKYMKSVGTSSDYDVFMELARQEFSKISKGYPYVDKLWWPRFEKMSEGFLQLDAERKRNVVKVETDGNFFWNVCDKIKVTSRCDRVEHQRDGRLSVVCYKIGATPSQIDLQCGFEPKGIVESICVAESTGIRDVSFAYWRITPESVDITEISDFADVFESARSGLQRFLVKYLEETIPFYQREDFSKFVEYELFSRIREHVPSSSYSR